MKTVLKENHVCSITRNDKNSKSPTDKYVVPHEQIIKVNPDVGKKAGISEKESLGILNPKGDPSWCQT